MECRYQHALASPAIAKRAEEVGLDLTRLHRLATGDLRKEVRWRYQELEEAQKNREELKQLVEPTQPDYMD